MGKMALTSDEEAQLAELEKKRGATVVRLVPNLAPTTTVYAKLHETLMRADEFEEVVVIAIKKGTLEAEAQCSSLPLSFQMGGAIFKLLMRLSSI